MTTAKRSPFIGYIAAVCISLAASVGMPMVNIFPELVPGELMMVRGSVTALLVSFIILYRVQHEQRLNLTRTEKERIPIESLYLPSIWMIGFSLLFSTATVPFYYGIRAWGAGPSLVVLTGTPIVNIAAKIVWHRKPVALRVFVAMAFLTIGVIVALNPFGATFNTKGLAYSITATVLAGIAFEVLSARKGADPYNKNFWLGVVTVGIGIVATAAEGRVPFATEVWEPQHSALLVCFGLTAGFLYYMAYIAAFENLDTEVASVIAMLETPVVIFGAWVILDETFGPMQAIGVAIACAATVALIFADHQSKKEAAANDPRAPA